MPPVNCQVYPIDSKQLHPHIDIIPVCWYHIKEDKAFVNEDDFYGSMYV